MAAVFNWHHLLQLLIIFLKFFVPILPVKKISFCKCRIILVFLLLRTLVYQKSTHCFSVLTTAPLNFLQNVRLRQSGWSPCSEWPGVWCQSAISDPRLVYRDICRELLEFLPQRHLWLAFRISHTVLPQRHLWLAFRASLLFPT